LHADCHHRILTGHMCREEACLFLRKINKTRRSSKGEMAIIACLEGTRARYRQSSWRTGDFSWFASFQERVRHGTHAGKHSAWIKIWVPLSEGLSLLCCYLCRALEEQRRTMLKAVMSSEARERCEWQLSHQIHRRARLLTKHVRKQITLWHLTNRTLNFNGRGLLNHASCFDLASWQAFSELCTCLLPCLQCPG